MRKKIVWLPYDFDTAIGINNEGALVFDYSLEDTDHLEGGADVYNGQSSVVWNNIRRAFAPELAEMYKQLRSTGALSYTVVEQMFEEHQAAWPEAIFNEDAWYKYILPLIDDGTGSYLEMLQGSKAEQRKWWLYNRFRYIDSKYNAGDALSDVIQLRGYAKADITVTPYADIYPTVKYGSYLVHQRGKRGVAATLVCPLDKVNDTEIYIYSASQLASVGDLSGLKVGFADLSMGTRLQAVKLGDSNSEYSNPNLKTLTLGNNELLKVIDVRNCTALGTGDQKTVDASGCVILEEEYFEGTQITALSLPNGGAVRVVHLPATITNLTLLNQSGITDFQLASAANITTLRLENVSSAIDEKAILGQIAANSRVRLVGFYWTATDAAEIRSLFDILDTMRGLDGQGGNLPTAWAEGEIHTAALTGDEIAELNARYPYVRVTADHTTTYRYYYSYDGETLLHTETLQDGATGGLSTMPPSRSSTAQYSYTPIGWSYSQDSTTVDAFTPATTNQNVYAAYSQTLRTYTATFVKASDDGGGTLYTQTNVSYGTTPTYGGATPTTSKGSATDYPFEGWTPALGPITGNTTYTAVFGSPAVIEEITDDWDTIIANIDNGTYKTAYKVGNYKPLDLGTEGTVNMQIVAFDADELANGNGYAPISWLSMELLETKHRMNPPRSGSSGAYDEGTGAIGGWEKCEMRTYLKQTIKPLIPQVVRNRINAVTKYSRIFNSVGSAVNDVASEEDVWLPSRREMFGTTVSRGETQGPIYGAVYPDNASRIKTNTSEDIHWSWFCRSAYSDSSFSGVKDTGDAANVRSNSVYAIPVGFCLGLEPETITDSWETILANENPSQSYAIGDTKSITINNEPHLMQIVGFGVDDKTSGGKAKISWLMKDQLTTTHRMNDSFSNENGWPVTGMRTWLRDTILPTIDSSIRSHIVDVDKTYYDYTDKTTEISSDNIWLASVREIFGDTSYESSGIDYTALFADATSRIKKCSGLAEIWWLRSANSTNANSFRHVSSGGNGGGNNANRLQGVCVGFCTD